MHAQTFFCASFLISVLSPSHIYLTCNRINKYIIAQAAMNLQIVFFFSVRAVFQQSIQIGETEWRNCNEMHRSVLLHKHANRMKKKQAIIYKIERRVSLLTSNEMRNVPRKKCLFNSRARELIINSIDCT